MIARDIVVAVRSHPACLEHVPTIGHPDTTTRVRKVLEALEEPPGGGWLVEAEAAMPDDDDIVGVLKWIHEPGYIERVREASRIGQGELDTPDCPVSEGTFRAAIAAAGLAFQTALDLVNDRLVRAFVAVRPPGHHAERARAKGFCFFNNVAVAAEVVVRAWNAPVLVVDFDVHHGNGTQELFYERKDVGYVSVHRYPFFPGSGAGDEIGQGRGVGTTRNVPLAPGADDDVFATALEDALEEIGARLQPAALVVSAGFDAHEHDPVGGMRVTAAGFRRMTTAIVQAAEQWSGGRVVSVLEGGHNPAAVAASAVAHVEALSRVG